MVPVDFEDSLTLPVPAPYSEKTTVLSAHRTLRAAKRLAVQLALAPHVPHRCDNLDLGNWFDSPVMAKAAASHPGPWAEDPHAGELPTCREAIYGQPGNDLQGLWLLAGQPYS